MKRKNKGEKEMTRGQEGQPQQTDIKSRDDLRRDVILRTQLSWSGFYYRNKHRAGRKLGEEIIYCTLLATVHRRRKSGQELKTEAVDLDTKQNVASWPLLR